MNYLERRGTLCRYPWINIPVQLLCVAGCLIFATPLACACFKQKATIPYSKLEKPLRDELDIKFKGNPPQIYYYNKGL